MSRVKDQGIDVESVGTKALLAAYTSILDELNKRHVVRTRNAPAGDLAETLARLVYQGTLAPNSEKSWDVEAKDGRRVQVKALVVADGKHRGNFSVFRTTEGFDVAVFVVFKHDYTVHSAIEAPAGYIAENAKHVAWVNGGRISAATDLSKVAGAQDLTAKFQNALDDHVDPARANAPLPVSG